MDATAPVRKFEVLKDWGVFKEGAIIAPFLLPTPPTEEEVVSLTSDGTLLEVVDHTVTEEDIANNLDAGYTLGEIIQIPLEAEPEKTPEELAAEKKVEDEAAAKAAEEAAAAAVPAVPKKLVLRHAGKTVIRESRRTVNGRT